MLVFVPLFRVLYPLLIRSLSDPCFYPAYGKWGAIWSCVLRLWLRGFLCGCYLVALWSFLLSQAIMSWSLSSTMCSCLRYVVALHTANRWHIKAFCIEV